jgi:hypothetical protein
MDASRLELNPGLRSFSHHVGSIPVHSNPTMCLSKDSLGDQAADFDRLEMIVNRVTRASFRR